MQHILLPWNNSFFLLLLFPDEPSSQSLLSPKAVFTVILIAFSIHFITFFCAWYLAAYGRCFRRCRERKIQKKSTTSTKSSNELIASEEEKDSQQKNLNQSFERRRTGSIGSRGMKSSLSRKDPIYEDVDNLKKSSKSKDRGGSTRRSISEPSNESRTTRKKIANYHSAV